MEWEIILAQLSNGLSLGSVYALVALGYTMLYGIIKLINFAHGEIYMLGAYFGYFAITAVPAIANFRWPLLPAILISMVLAALVGIVLEKVAYRPLRKAPRIAA